MPKTVARLWLGGLFLMGILPGITGLGYADTVIDTTPSWNGLTPVFSFGPGQTETYGQTITAPLTDAVLRSWTFYMKQDTAVQFQGEVYAWNGTMATGPDLFESALMTTTDSSVFQPITFNTGGLALTPGDTYVLFASSSQGNQTPTLGGGWGFIPRGSVYAGGAFVFINNGNDISKWTSSAWATNWEGTGNDLAFKADFSSVPEPSVRILLALALGALFVLTRQGRKVSL